MPNDKQSRAELVEAVRIADAFIKAQESRLERQASRIEALEAENARQREALRPIAEVADRFDGDIAWSDDYAPLYPLSLRNFRFARSVLKPERSEHGQG